MRRLEHAVLCAMLAACGGDDGGGGGVDANDGTCLPGAYDIDKEWGFTTGPYAISGTVTLPAMLASGRGLQLNILQDSPGSGNTIDFAFVPAAKTTVTYRARGLVDGSWSICLRADADGNNMLDDVGVDYTGCFDGTVAAPMTMPFDATPIVLGGMCQSGKDFGVGLYN